MKKNILKKTAVPKVLLNNNANHQSDDEILLLQLSRSDYKKKYEFLQVKHIRLRKHNERLSRLLFEANRKINSLEKNLKKAFTSDQIQTLKSTKNQFNKCSNETLEKSLRLRFPCGQTGYNDLRKIGLPFPSIRTLNLHLQHLDFQSGILTDVFTLLKIKISNYSTTFEKDCMLTLDEMEIKKSMEFCVATNSFTGGVTIPNQENILASKALVFMFGRYHLE